MRITQFIKYLTFEASRCHARVTSDFLDERYKECVSRAERCIQTVQIHKASEVGRKYEIVANLYALKGNAHFQLEQYKEALRCYHRDLEIAKEK